MEKKKLLAVQVLPVTKIKNVCTRSLLMSSDGLQMQEQRASLHHSH
jgi:hypothetical protein